MFIPYFYYRLFYSIQAQLKPAVFPEYFLAHGIGTMLFKRK